MIANKELVKFIKEARNKGFSDLQIREPLIKRGWPLNEVEKAFLVLNPKFKLKNQVCIFLSKEILAKLEKRAHKNMFTLSEQIEDILRRSCLGKGQLKEEKLDDTLVSLFSRRAR